MLTPEVSADLVTITTHQRQLTGQRWLSQEQVVADLIRAAREQLERDLATNTESPQPPAPRPVRTRTPKRSQPQAPSAAAEALAIPDTGDAVPPPAAPAHAPTDSPAANAPTPPRQRSAQPPPVTPPPHPAPAATPAEIAATITQVRPIVTELLATLRGRTTVSPQDGKRLLSLVTQLMTLHAAQVAPRAILEALNHPYRVQAHRDEALAKLLQQPPTEYRQAEWEEQLRHMAEQLASGPIRRQAEQWALIKLADQISGAAMITNDRIAELTTRLAQRRVDPTPWLDQLAQAKSPPTQNTPPATATPAATPVAARTLPAAAQPEITGVRMRTGTSHDLSEPGRTRCGQYLPPDPDDVTWLRDLAFLPTCRRCLALRRPSITKKQR